MKTLANETNAPTPAVVRSENVPALENYNEYKHYLRFDFLHSCAYCTVAEAEAGAVRFTIDHYEPKSARPDLKDAYSNLMWSCDECNIRKGDLTPPPKARDEGIRFFRADEDIASEHYELVDVRLKHLTRIGEFTIDFVDLNRLALRRLRDLRNRLLECDRYVQEGVFALRRAHIDRLPQKLKGRVSRSIAQAQQMGDRIANDIDDLLRSFAKSDMIDPDPESEQRMIDRKKRLREHQSLQPGKWRGRDF